MVEPVDILQGGVLHVVEAPPRATMADQLGLVQPVEGLGQGIVVAVAARADRGDGPGLGQALGVPDGEVLRRPDRSGGSAPSALARRAQSAISRASSARSVRERAGDLPADDEAGADIHHEGDVDPAAVGLDVGEVGDPQPIRGRRSELASDQVERAACSPRRRSWCERWSCRGPRPAARAGASAARPCSGRPGSPRASAAPRPCRRRRPAGARPRPAGSAPCSASSRCRRAEGGRLHRGVVAARGDLQLPADRLDSPAVLCARR